MPRQRAIVAAAALSLALAGLGCQTLTSIGPAPSVPAPSAAPPNPSAESSKAAASAPTLGTPRETRIAASARTPTLEQAAAETYASAELNRVNARLTYTIQVARAATPLLWGYAWCAANPERLAQNLGQIQVEFLAGGQTLQDGQLDEFQGQTQGGLYCRGQRAVVKAWPTGTTTLETRITFRQTLNDGLADYPPGQQVITYSVTAP